MPEPHDYCDRCMSTGFLLTSPCPDCAGTGRKKEPMVSVAGKFGEPQITIPKRWTET